jgi:hypothetical protein
MKVIAWIKQYKLLVVFIVVVIVGFAIAPYILGVLLTGVGVPILIWWYLWGRKRMKRKEHMGECPICHKCFVFFDDSIPEYGGPKQTIKRVCKECSAKTVEGNK